MSLYGSSATPLVSRTAEDQKGPTYPLSFLKENEPATIIKISGNDDIRRHLGGLGFVPGTIIRIVSAVNGNVIVDVRGSRVAIDSCMAGKIKCGPVS